MPEKVQESLKIALQILLPFLLLFVSTTLSQKWPLAMVNKILVVVETVLFATACLMNLFHFVRISLLMCVPPLCLRSSCRHLKWLLLLFGVIAGNYIFLSISWLLAYDSQQLIAVLDLLYNLIEITLAVFGIMLAMFANGFVKRQRSEPIQECQS